MAKLTRAKWAKQFPECWICGRLATDVMPLHTHELASGPARQASLKEPAAWFRTCLHCHSRLPNLVICLAYKKYYDWENYDRVRVNLLRSRQPEAISESQVLRQLKKIAKAAGMLAAIH